MIHTTHLMTNASDGPKNLLVRATGKFYTPATVGERLAQTLIPLLNVESRRTLRLVDPFCGDGRLITAILREGARLSNSKEIQWSISCWDIDDDAVKIARAAILSVAEEKQLDVFVDARSHDTLLEAATEYGTFDCVVTNPPWEGLKPDRRELTRMSPEQRDEYRASLRSYDRQLAQRLPLSQPTRKFAGWGTNLSRCGTEVALRLTAEGGICGIVIPSSLLSDQASAALRRWLLTQATWIAIDHYPAEARLFEGVDQPFVVAALRRTRPTTFQPAVTRFAPSGDVLDESVLSLSEDELLSLNYCLPVEYGRTLVHLQRRLESFQTLGDLRGQIGSSLWLGRELDETGHEAFLADSGRFLFLKGRMVGRYTVAEVPTRFIREDLREIPVSAHFERIVWRDVSRRSQARRMHAALIPPGVVTGNSLHVGYFRDGDLPRLRALLAVMNSIPFEFQVRSRLGTGHVSLGAVKETRIPNLYDPDLVQLLASAAVCAEDGMPEAEANIEVLVARSYGLRRSELAELLSHFDRLPEEEVRRILDHPKWNDIEWKPDVWMDSENLKEQTRVTATVLGI